MFEGKKVTSDNVLQLVETLVSGGQAATAQQPTLPAGSAASLLGGILEAGQGSAPPAIDISDLLSAGMSFLNAKQGGQGDVDALMGATGRNPVRWLRTRCTGPSAVSLRASKPQRGDRVLRNPA